MGRANAWPAPKPRDRRLRSPTLNLQQTDVTDEGLPHLEKLARLRQLNLSVTFVIPAEALPGHEGYLEGEVTEAPAGTPVYFQALNDRNQVIQSIRSWATSEGDIVMKRNRRVFLGSAAAGTLAVARAAHAQAEGRKLKMGVVGGIGKLVQVDARIHYRAGTKDPTPQDPPDTLDWDLWCGPGPKIPYSPQVGHHHWRLEKTSGHGHMANFLDCARTRKQPDCPIEEGYRTTATVQLAMISHETKSVVDWDAQAEQIVDNPAAAKLLRREYRPPWKHPHRA